MITTKGVVFMVALLLAVATAWAILGFYPWRSSTDAHEAASFGDSFGFVNSLFSCFAFAFALSSLCLQMRELHETSKTQAEQTELQAKQMELAKQTALIQESTLRDSRKRQAMDAFLKINQDVFRFRHALLDWHPENNP